MLHEVVDDEESAFEASTLLAAFEALLSDAVADAGMDRVVAETELDADDVRAIRDGTVADLTLEESAEVLATSCEPDVDAILFELRDHLLMGMATAVLDVDTIAGAIDADLTGQEIQQAVEGRAEMTLAQLAEIMAVIENRTR